MYIFKEAITILQIRQFIQDVYSSDAKVYWQDEGNNKRMRFYISITKVLNWVQLLLTLIVVVYLTSIATNSIIEILSNTYTPNIINISIKNIYQVSLVFTIVLNILEYKYNSISKYNFCKGIIRSIFVFPVIVLIILNGMIANSLMQTFWILTTFVTISIFIKTFSERVDCLGKIASGITYIDRKADIEINKDKKGKEKEKNKK